MSFSTQFLRFTKYYFTLTVFYKIFFLYDPYIEGMPKTAVTIEIPQYCNSIFSNNTEDKTLI